MGMTITTHTDSFTIDMGGLSKDRKKARVKYNDIRSIVTDTDNETVEVVFSSGEIYYFNFNVIDSIDGDTNISSQDILYDKIEAILFA